MSEKRRDNKGRILKTGESQRKDGRYLYKYIDSFGEPQFVYSWKLVATDRVPAGKRDCISLREKIAELQKDIHLENRNLFTRGNLWLQTEYQQESVIVSHLERKSQSYRKTFMMVLMLQERK